LKLLILGLSLTFSLSTLAQEQVDLSILCGHGALPKINKQSIKKIQVEETEIVILDNGFCSAYEASLIEESLNKQYSTFSQDKRVEFESRLKKTQELRDDQAIEKPSEDKWKIRFYASHSFTTYFSSDIKFRSTRYNVDIKDYEWVERSSRKFFLPSTWQEKGNNPFQMIDEPSNTFVISIEKDGHEFFLSAFHPKFLHNNEQVKYMEGVIDGTPVEGWHDVNRPFDGYNQEAGEMELVRNENTHLQMTFEIGYGYRFKIIDTKIGNITYVPSVALGVMFGGNLTVVIQENEWWEFDDYKDKNRIQGFGGSITNRIEFNTKNEIFGIFYENKIALYHQKHGFMDGTQEYNIGFTGNSVGLKFSIYNPNNWKNGKRIKRKKSSPAPMF
jgi:hypothetical protein